jgi:hypothetical protein
LVTRQDIPDNAFENIPDGATIFSLKVDNHKTLGNSIMPGNYIDLYLHSNDEESKVIFGKFIESIKVLSVRDSGGNDVFADSQAVRDSWELLFAVKNDYYILLKEAEYVGIDIIPVPRNAQYRDEGIGTKVSREELVTFILEKVSELSDEINQEEILNAIENNNNNNNNTTE